MYIGKLKNHGYKLGGDGTIQNIRPKIQIVGALLEVATPRFLYYSPSKGKPLALLVITKLYWEALLRSSIKKCIKKLYQEAVLRHSIKLFY